MKNFEKFTNEELIVIKSALYRTIDDYERGVWFDEKEYKIAKGLFSAIQSILDEAEND